jgi:hypothetical protein
MEHISTFITIKVKLKEKYNLRKQYRSLIIKTKLNKAIKDLKKLLSVEKMQAYKYICVISISLKYLITFYGRLLKN